MKITDFSIENRTTVLVLMVILAIVGSFCYVVLPRESAPDIPVPYFIVTTFYEGVAPSDIETLITMKIEKELKGLSDLKEMRSTSIEGFSTVMLEFEPDIDIDDALQKVREKVDLAQPELPTDLEDEPTIAEFNFSEMPVMLVNINGGDDQVRLKAIADELEDAIEGLPGVLRVDVSGALEREIRLEFDPDRLSAYRINPAEAIVAVAQNNVTVPSGNLELGDANYVVKVPGEFRDPDEINNIVVAVRDARPVYLLDVARVVDGFEEPQTYSRLNARPTVTLAVVKRSGENIIEVTDRVKALLEKAAPMLPRGVSFSVTADMSKDVRLMVSDLENNILSGLILIMVVILVSLGMRDAALVSLAIPFSMMITFAVLTALDITLNFVVLFSLTLALGMLVDNAIVVVENIHRHHNSGLRRIVAARVATREVAWPITTSALTTICAFFPMLFWPGIMGEFMGYLPRTVIITLAASLFVALVITPVAATVIMKREIELNHQSFRESVFVRLYTWLLRQALRHRFSTVVLACGFLVVMVQWFAASKLGTEFFPETEPNSATINVKLPEGSSLDASDEIVRRVEAAALKYPESKAVVANSGGGLQGGDIMSGSGNKTNESHITLEFVDREDRRTPSSRVIELLRRDLGDVVGAEVTVEKQEEGPPTGAAIALEISGKDFAVLGRIAEDLRKRLRGVRGAVDIKDDFIKGKPEIRVHVDKERAALLGLTTNMVGQMIRTAIQGSKAGVYRVGNDEYDVIVRMPKARRMEVDTLGQMRIPTQTGAQVPLSTLADIEYASGLGSISRVDERRTVTITGDVAKGVNQNVVLAEAKRMMQQYPLPAGYSYRFMGQNKEQEDSQVFLSKAFLAALFLIAMVLVMQFDSLTLPFIILTSVILSLIGVFLGLVLTGTSFGVIMTGIGVISLAGVVVNNSIVLIDYTEKLRHEGCELLDAVVRACTVRFRPVMLTAITTILGLIPMATGLSFDFRERVFSTDSQSSELWGPMAVAVIFGLAVATLLTLVVVPSLYVILDRLRGESGRERFADAEVHPEAALAAPHVGVPATRSEPTEA